MESKTWLFDVYQIVGGFMVALIGYSIMQAGSRWLQAKLFGKKNGSGMSSGNNGRHEAQMDELIELTKSGNKALKCLPDIAANSKKTREIVAATDEDGVPRVHNKPSVERVIKKIWAKVSGGLNGD